jgi:hypothetical protein
MLKELDMKNKRVKKEEAAFKLLREVRANSIDGDKISLEYHKKVNEERKTGVGKRKGGEGLMIDPQWGGEGLKKGIKTHKKKGEGEEGAGEL